ncbi:unnamed protein product [Ostreobium quekettii]|uniref:Uncharacterized protein n=1 Tax=Ostreobium quekettii TaxID=121088 RepID=A0A8S1IMW3_9CHLO|nr:unnamed protein product [Ostreobium quekettii]
MSRAPLARRGGVNRWAPASASASSPPRPPGRHPARRPIQSHPRAPAMDCSNAIEEAGNGSAGSAVAAGQIASSGKAEAEEVEGGDGMRDQVADLARQVAELKGLVAAQAAALEAQRMEVGRLRAAAAAGEGEEGEGGDGAGARSPLQAQAVAMADRRFGGRFDARFHSLSRGAIPEDFRVLPKRIILVRHAQSEGNVNKQIYSHVPDRNLGLTEGGWEQAIEAGKKLRRVFERDGDANNFKLFFFISPYRRSYETYEGIRFPNGESGADVYDRITIFEDHLIRDINAGRWSQDNTNLVLVTHGLSLRIILMRWFHWTVDQFLTVYNPPNAVPVVLERIGPNSIAPTWMHTKMLYRMSPHSLETMKGCTEDMVKHTVSSESCIL